MQARRGQRACCKWSGRSTGTARSSHLEASSRGIQAAVGAAVEVEVEVAEVEVEEVEVEV